MVAKRLEADIGLGALGRRIFLNLFMRLAASLSYIRDDEPY